MIGVRALSFGSITKKMVNILNTMKFDKNNQLWFADNPNFDYVKNSQPFPDFIDKIRSDVEKITSFTFNLCLITKNNTQLYDISYDWLDNIFLIPSIIIGSSIQVEFVSKKYNKINTITIDNGSLLIERESVKKYWDIGVD